MRRIIATLVFLTLVNLTCAQNVKESDIIGQYEAHLSAGSKNPLRIQYFLMPNGKGRLETNDGCECITVYDDIDWELFGNAVLIHFEKTIARKNVSLGPFDPPLSPLGKYYLNGVNLRGAMGTKIELLRKYELRKTEKGGVDIFYLDTIIEPAHSPKPLPPAAPAAG